MKNLMRIEKDGRVYWYYRRKGHPLVPLPDPDSPKFARAYADAQEAVPPAKSKAGSIAALIETAKRSDRFKSCSTIYRDTLTRHFEAIRKRAGKVPARGLRDKHIRKDVYECENPTDRRKAWRFLCAVALDRDLLDIDPSASVPPPKTAKTTGHPPWTDADKTLYRERWPIGTVRRAAMELLNWTGFRLGDAVMIGRPHVDKHGVLVYAQSKVQEPAFIPWTNPLPDYAASLAGEREMMHEALAAIDSRQLTFLATEKGATRSGKALGNMIRESARKAGIEKSGHGLRKTRAIELAENGASAHAIMSWLGHQTLKEAEHYTKLASRRRAVLGVEQEQNVANKNNLVAN